MHRSWADADRAPLAALELLQLVTKGCGTRTNKVRARAGGAGGRWGG